MVTGSSGKTTALHLIKARLGRSAKYSIKANSAIGIPFDLLGLRRKTLLVSEWPMLFFKAPFRTLSKVPKEKIYVVEADCDRPGEGNFIGGFLCPDTTLWISSSKTHSMNFDQLVSAGTFPKVEDAVKNEFYELASFTKELIIMAKDIEITQKEMDDLKAEVLQLNCGKKLKKYSVDKSGTTFEIGKDKFVFPHFLPRVTCLSLIMIEELLARLSVEVKKDYSSFTMPPGRSSLFRGIKNTTLVDSSYNANLDSVGVVIDCFSRLRGVKWAVLSDMLEQGVSDRTEHEKLASLILDQNFDKVILMGPRVGKYTKPILERNNLAVVHFNTPKKVLTYLVKNISGGEIILFKGARFLEGVIEQLLVDKRDVRKLARQEKIWKIRRKKWGL